MPDLNPRESYGQLFLVDNNIESLTPELDINIGLATSSANIVAKRDLVLSTGKTLTFGDATVQATAAGVPVSYVPVLTDGGTLAYGAGAVTGSYMKVGKKVDFRIRINMASFTNFGTAAYFLTLPVAPAADYNFNDGIAYDASTTTSFPVSLVATAGSTTAALKYVSVSSSKGTLQPLTHDSLFAFAVADHLIISGTYEAA